MEKTLQTKDKPKKNIHAQRMARLRHKKNPMTKEFYSQMGKKGAAKRWAIENDKLTHAKA